MMPVACLNFIALCTLMNRHHKPSTSIQTISNIIYLIYVYQCDKSTIKQSFVLQISCIELSKTSTDSSIYITLPQWVCVMGKPCLLIFIIIIHCSPLSFRRSCSFLRKGSAVCARFVAQLCYARVVGIIQSCQPHPREGVDSETSSQPSGQSENETKLRALNS